MRWLVAVTLLGAVGCAPPDGGEAKFWAVADFFAKAGTSADFGGYAPDDLVDQSTSTLKVLPGVAQSAARGYLITELWRDHPLPWLQPVWTPVEAWDPVNPRGRTAVDSNGAILRNVFPVDVAASFYSPFWRSSYVVVGGEMKEQSGFDSAETVLSYGNAHPGGMVLCPIVPEGVSVETPTVHPYTGEALRTPGVALSFVDRRVVHYLAIGPGRAPWHDDVVEASELFVFVDPAGRSLPIPAVLPDAPDAHSLAWRTNVVLSPSAAIFVPPSQPGLRADLEQRGQTIHPVGTGIAVDVANTYAGRVATKEACFLDAAFPASCTWLDSVSALGSAPKVKTTTLVTFETLGAP